MKKLNFLFLVLVVLFFAQCSKKNVYKSKTKTDSNGYTYEYVTNDPINARIYTLANGLKVYLTVNKDEPRIQTCIPVKAGSTYDPAETTGLAHYLEHMMFKGTDEFGTKDWAKEEAVLKQISDLFELHKNSTNQDEKKAIYKKIDSLSTIAASYAIPNEYDKLITSIGGSETNAYTSNEETVYINVIPSNQMENWLIIEKERFSKLVLRLFHTELETVYEEFNMSQDNDYTKVEDLKMSCLFPNHPYGTQSTIGKGEHLKNPSMVNIQKYWSTYYVPNNMAICMSGDLNFEETIKLIDNYFGKLEPKDVPEFKYPESPTLTQNVTKEVVGPDAEYVSLAYRFDGIKSEDYEYVTLINQILSNYVAGLIDLDLVQTQKVLQAGAYPWFLKQYGMQEFYANLREGQTFDQVRDLLLAEIEKIKKGDFEEWMLEAAVKDFKFNKIRRNETNYVTFSFVESFVNSVDWADYVAREDKLSKITKEQLVKFANEKYNNYVAIYKKNGLDSSAIKIEKPQLTAIDLNRSDKSTFFTNIEKNKVNSVEPVWLDFKNQIAEENIVDGVTFNYIKNETNDLFKLYYVFDMGKNHDKKLPLAIRYLDYIGTNDKTPADIRKEFYKLGISLYVNAMDDRSYVSITGLEESMEDATKLFENLLNNAKADTSSYNKFIDGIIKGREDAKLDKYSIMYDGIFSFAKYGKFSPFTDIISEADLRAIDPNSLTDILKNLEQYKHRIFYYGTNEMASVKETINKYHILPATLKDIPTETDYPKLEFTENKVYVVDYDMVQTWLLMVTKDESFNKNIMPFAKIFGEYFGSGLSSIVFQEIREARALAYSAYSTFRIPQKVTDNYYSYSYIATQADKLGDATNAMLALLNQMPKADIQFEAAKTSVLQNYQTDRITKSNIFWSYMNCIDLKIDNDFRKDIYEGVKNMDINQLEDFFNKHIKGKNYTFIVLGNKNLIDMKTLEKLGKVEILSLQDIYNY